MSASVGTPVMTIRTGLASFLRSRAALWRDGLVRVEVAPPTYRSRPPPGRSSAKSAGVDLVLTPMVDEGLAEDLAQIERQTSSCVTTR